MTAMDPRGQQGDRAALGGAVAAGEGSRLEGAVAEVEGGAAEPGVVL
jgi:hypothetical protein